MLFSYEYLPRHNIYKLQQWVDQIFLDVWCKADLAIDYSIDLLPYEIKEITLEIYNSENIKKDYFYGPIERVYKIFQTINQPTKIALAKYYNDNNAIEDLCKGTPGFIPFRYVDLSVMNFSLKEELEEFFKNLFDSVIDLSSVKNTIKSSLDDHYKDFVTINNKDICPICGLLPIDNQFDSTRDSYDHYLPKSKYPFNSVNFYNLAPICYKCNSSNKSSNDPLHSSKNARRKAFYIYSNEQHDIDISLLINTNDLLQLKPENIEIEFGPADKAEELQTWDSLFGIKTRYKATCSGADGRNWISQILDEFQIAGIPVQDALRKKIREAENCPFHEKNFLRKPFLEACIARNIFSTNTNKSEVKDNE